MQKQFRAPKDADVNELLLQVGCNGQPQDLRDNNFDDSQGRFISCTAYPNLVALCYHESKNHAAIVEVHNGFTSLFGAPDQVHRRERAEAQPGYWAYACTHCGRLGGDKALFEYW